MGGHPVATSRSSRPHWRRCATPGGWIRWVETVSLGNSSLSTSRTLPPVRASSMATGAPAQRAPTTIASNTAALITSSAGGWNAGAATIESYVRRSVERLPLDVLLPAKLERLRVVTGGREPDGHVTLGAVLPVPAMNP